METTLPAEVAKHFDCEGLPGVIITAEPHRQRIDLRTISLSQARKLHAEGYLPMLKAKEQEPVKKRSK